MEQPELNMESGSLIHALQKQRAVMNLDANLSNQDGLFMNYDADDETKAHCNKK